MKHTAYLAFSSNLGDRVANLRNALIALPPLMRIWAASYVYEAQSKDSSQPPFLNLVARATTDLTPLGLLKYLKKKEAELGRDPNISAGLFKIDIDILFYDDITFKKGGLIIPHPRLHERIFVLEGEPGSFSAAVMVSGDPVLGWWRHPEAYVCPTAHE